MHGRLGHDVGVESVTEVDGVDVITIQCVMISLILSPRF